jgi:hypothetical protein
MARFIRNTRRAALSILLAGITLPGCSRTAADTLEWLSDYREGLRQARQTHKPMLVEFRCGP